MLRAALIVLCVGCAPGTTVLADADSIGKRLEGAWVTSDEVVRTHVPHSGVTDVPAHTLTLTVDPSVRDVFPRDELRSIAPTCFGRAAGLDKPSVFVLGELNGKACLLMLSDLGDTPYGDSDGGRVWLRPGPTRDDDVLLIRGDSPEAAEYAYERR